jgi:hypothetical protein
MMQPPTQEQAANYDRICNDIALAVSKLGPQETVKVVAQLFNDTGKWHASIVYPNGAVYRLSPGNDLMDVAAEQARELYQLVGDISVRIGRPLTARRL